MYRGIADFKAEERNRIAHPEIYNRTIHRICRNGKPSKKPCHSRYGAFFTAEEAEEQISIWTSVDHETYIMMPR